MASALCFAASGLLLLSIASVLIGCTPPAPGAQGGKATYEREKLNDAGKVTEREKLTINQQDDPETGAGFTFTTPAGSTVDTWWGQSYFRELPVDNGKLKWVLVVIGSGMILGAIALATPYIGGPHLRLCSLLSVGGLVMIAIAFTIEKYAAWYAAGVALVVGLCAWMAWSAYKSGQFNPPEFPNQKAVTA